MQSYLYPQKISKIICSDLDETFMPFKDKDKPGSGIPELENFLLENIIIHSMIFGIITGSNLTSTLRKMSGHATYYPHFIASSLGTEFYWIKNNEIIESKAWIQLIENSGFKKENINNILGLLKEAGVALTFQSEDYQGKYKSTLYYYIQDDIARDFSLMQHIAADFNMKVLFNKCNPSAGDPENCYDIEFLPLCCGKGEVIDFLKSELKLSSDDFYCFGDSFNDFSMFARTKHSYLVGNADPEAKKSHTNVLKENYCRGIKAKMQEILTIEKN